MNLLGVARCSDEELAQERCPASSQVGVYSLQSGFVALAEEFRLGLLAPVYNIRPTSPNVPGEVGFNVPGAHIVVHAIGRVSASHGYALAAETPGIDQLADLDGVTVTLWGDPSSASHDAQRGKCATLNVPPECREPVERTGRPFLTLPARCPTAGEPGVESVRGELSAWAEADSWQEPEPSVPAAPGESSPLAAFSGCENLSFTPSLDVRPETTVADSPTGLEVDLRVPQGESIGSLAEADLKEAVVTLPAGLTVSSAAAGGLGACSEAQIGLGSPAAPSCPESSKIGSVEVSTPLLEHALHGAVYLAQQGNAGPGQGSNPFGSLIAMYMVIEGSGILVKVPGVVSLNQSTGQLTTRFGQDPRTGFYLPQVPFSELKLNFFGGPRAPLVPSVCGSYTTTSVLTPWSAPGSGPPATPQSSFQISSNCPAGGFTPALTAGTTSNQAGGFSPFVATFERHDGEQELGAIQVRMPPGLLAMLSKVPLCGEPQASQGTCGEASRIGSVSASVGPGTNPFSVTGGRAYLTGPYRGAPFGLTFVVPAVAGPFNLGNVVVRAAISVDQATSAVTITSDPLPVILQGVPLQVRSVTVSVDRPEFIFNPSSCEHMQIAATMQGSLGASPAASVPFQAASCASLKFAPTFKASTQAKTSKRDGASLDTKVIYPQAPQGTYANIAKVKVELPKQLPSRLTTIQKACPGAIFDANPASCPPESAIGVVRATTPLLPVPLSGPAYLVSHGGEAFPDIVIVLQGDGVRVDLTGSIFISKAGITSTTFNAIPDVPVGSFELYLPEGPHSALATTASLCTTRLTLPNTFTAQNGAVIHQSTKITVTGCPKPKAKKAKKAHKAGRAHRGGRRS